jgi:hypothetical protein
LGLDRHRRALKRWLAARRIRRQKRREHRAMGVCPDCGTYLAAHKAFGHGVSKYL